jgi:hypothetical protein
LRTAARDMTDPSGAGVALASSGAGGREFPLGGMQGGHGKDARSVTAIRQVAGAHLAYHLLCDIDTEPKDKIMKSCK